MGLRTITDLGWRRVSAAVVIDRRRSTFEARIAICRSMRRSASSRSNRRSLGSSVARKRSRVSSRAASSSSS
jgi:hypothetical protein